MLGAILDRREIITQDPSSVNPLFWINKLKQVFIEDKTPFFEPGFQRLCLAEYYLDDPENHILLDKEEYLNLKENDFILAIEFSKDSLCIWPTGIKAGNVGVNYPNSYVLTINRIFPKDITLLSYKETDANQVVVFLIPWPNKGGILD